MHAWNQEARLMLVLVQNLASMCNTTAHNYELQRTHMYVSVETQDYLRWLRVQSTFVYIAKLHLTLNLVYF